MARPTAQDVRAAFERLDDETIVQQTPVDYSRSISEIVGGNVRLKMEQIQRTGSFKISWPSRNETAISGPSSTSARDDLLKVGEAFLAFVVETSGRGHATAIREAIAECGYEVERIN